MSNKKKTENETEENSSSTYRKEKVNIMARTNQKNNTVAKKAENTKEVKVMKANEIQVITEEQMDNMMAEGWSMEPADDDTQVVLKKGRKKVIYQIKEWLPKQKASKKSDKKKSDKNEEVQKQVHIARDRDIKIESKKVGDIGVKLIYHRTKDGTKQYRIYIAQKVDGVLKRNRLNNDELKAIDRDEAKCLNYFNKITKSEKTLKAVI